MCGFKVVSAGGLGSGKGQDVFARKSLLVSMFCVLSLKFRQFIDLAWGRVGLKRKP